MTDTVIVSGGMIQKDFALDFLKKLQKENKDQKLQLVAADRGLDFFRETGLVPDLADGDFSIDKVCVWLSSAAGEVYVCENAAYHPYSEDEAAKVLAEHDILVKVDMGTGDASAKAWGCDLTYDYVKINGDYRT